MFTQQHHQRKGATQGQYFREKSWFEFSFSSSILVTKLGLRNPVCPTINLSMGVTDGFMPFKGHLCNFKC